MNLVSDDLSETTETNKKMIEGELASELTSAQQTSEQTRRVYVLDDETSVLGMLKLMLTQAGYDVVAFDSPVDFLAQFRSLPSGVVLTDQVMGSAEGIDVLRRLSDRPSEFSVILMTAFPKMRLAVEAMRAGAVTVLDKPFERTLLVEAIEDAFRQLSASVEEESVLPPPMPGGRTYFEQLSSREKDVLRLVYDGATNKSIGIRLNISIKTVEKHRGRGMKKMGVGSLAALIRLMNREHTR
jgi:two-component system, LuxR family, response regulator FixJ